MNIDYRLIDLENILNSGGSDINTLRNLEKKSLRRTGRTTRIVDGLVQEVFKSGTATNFGDHYYKSPTMKEMVFKKVANRLMSEHNPNDFVFDPMRLVIHWKGFDDHRSYQERLKTEIEKLRAKIENATKP